MECKGGSLSVPSLLTTVSTWNKNECREVWKNSKCLAQLALSFPIHQQFSLKDLRKTLKQLNSDLMHCSCLDRLAYHPILMTGFSFQFPLPIYFFSNHYIWTLHELGITTERSNYYFLFITTQNSESEDCCWWSHVQWGSWTQF